MDRKIKTRQVHKDIKVLDKTVTVTDHVKHSYVRTKETVMQSTEKSSDRENNPVGMQKMRPASMLTASFTKQGIRYADRQERLLNGRKRKLLFLRQAKKQFTRRKNKSDQYRLQAEKRHRSREKDLLSKKSRPLNGIKEPSRPGEHRNRL